MPKRKVFQRTSVEATSKLLDEAAALEPEKPEHLNLQETLEYLAPNIQLMLQKGHSMEYIARILRNGLGEAFGLPDLKKLFEPVKRRKRRTSKTVSETDTKPTGVSQQLQKPQPTPHNESRMTVDELRNRS